MLLAAPVPFGGISADSEGQTRAAFFCQAVLSLTHHKAKGVVRSTLSRDAPGLIVSQTEHRLILFRISFESIPIPARRAPRLTSDRVRETTALALQVEQPDAIVVYGPPAAGAKLVGGPSASRVTRHRPCGRESLGLR